MANVINDFYEMSIEETIDFQKYLANNKVYYASDDIKWALTGQCKCGHCSNVVDLYNIFKNKSKYIEEDE